MKLSLSFRRIITHLFRWNKGVYHFGTESQITMKISDKHKKNYNRNLQICFITSLVLNILVFYLFPQSRISEVRIPEFTVPKMVVIDIPRTIQRTRHKAPRPLLPSILVPVDEMEMLDEVEILFEKVDSLVLPNPPDGPLSVDELPYVPRQILEVLPERTNPELVGTIRLLLLIGRDGKMKDFKLLENTTHSDKLLENVIKAVRKSRWEQVSIAESAVEYWIQKTYNFN